MNSKQQNRHPYCGDAAARLLDAMLERCAPVRVEDEVIATLGLTPQVVEEVARQLGRRATVDVARLEHNARRRVLSRLRRSGELPMVPATTPVAIWAGQKAMAGR